MRLFDPISLRLFISVCEEKGIAQAAEREAIVPSAVSKRLSALEEQAGTQLLKRGRRGVTLTPAGESLLGYAYEVVRSMERMHSQLEQYSKGIRGHIRIAASMSAIAEFLAEDVGRFIHSNDGIRVSLEEKVSSEVVRAVEDGRADAGVCWDGADLRQLVQIPYRRDHLAAIVARDHPLAGRKRLPFKDTLDFEHVAIQQGGAVQLLLIRQAAALGRTLRSRVQVSTFDAACRIVAAKLALAIVPQGMSWPFEQAFGLRTVPLTDRWASRRFAICVRNKEAMGAPTRLFVESLAASEGARTTP